MAELVVVPQENAMDGEGAKVFCRWVYCGPFCGQERPSSFSYSFCGAQELCFLIVPDLREVYVESRVQAPVFDT